MGNQNVVDFHYFLYYPSLAAAVIFIVVFGITTFLHVFQLLRSRTWYFIPLVIGGVFEILGYIGRAFAAKQAPNYTLAPYIMQSLLTLLAPTLFAASIYMILGRAIRVIHAEEYSVVPTRKMTKIFVLGDVVSFLAQGAGGGLLAQAKTKSQVDLANYVVIAGLGIQIIFFLAFVTTAAIFHYRVSRSLTTTQSMGNLPQIRYLWILYGASILILLRNIVRIIEFIQGYSGYIQSQEVFVYIFDALPMFIVMVLFNVYHPSSIVAGDSRSKDNSPQVDIESHHSGTPLSQFRR